MELRVSLTEVTALVQASEAWCPDVGVEPFTYAGYQLSGREGFELWLRHHEAVTRKMFYRSLASEAARMLVKDTRLAMMMAEQRSDLDQAITAWAAEQGEVPDDFLLEDLVVLAWEPAHEDAMLPRALEPYRVAPLGTGVSSVGVGGSWVLPRALAEERAYSGPVGTGRIEELVGTFFADEREAEDALALWERGSDGPLGDLLVATRVVRAF
jgi:Fe-S cluster biosynthesis and repair protein YggX